MKKLSAIFSLLFVSGWSCAAVQLQTVFNPFTGKPDYINVGSGGGGSTNGTINASQNGNVAAYSLPGSSTTLSGSSALQVFTSSVVANQTLYANGGVAASTMTISTQTVTGEIILPDGTIIKSTSTFGGGSTSPGLPLNSVQFNNAGALGGNANFTTDGSSVTVSTAVIRSILKTLYIPNIPDPFNQGNYHANAILMSSGNFVVPVSSFGYYDAGTGQSLFFNGTPDLVDTDALLEINANDSVGVNNNQSGGNINETFNLSGSGGYGTRLSATRGASNTTGNIYGANIGCFDSSTFESANCYAVYGQAISGSANYAGYFIATSANSDHNYGVYINAANGTFNHALDIAAGDFYLNGTPGATGNSLTSNGFSSSPSWGPLNLGGGSSYITGRLSSSNVPTDTVFNDNAISSTFVSSVTVKSSGGLGVTYGVNVGSMTGAGLTSCSGASNAVTWSSSTDQFGCNTISGSGGSSSLAVGTGTTSGYTGTITSSPTAVVLFDQALFKSTLQGGATNFITSISTITAASLGAVTSVTGTPPINSSGGATPAISLSATIGQGETFTGSSVTVAGVNGLTVTGATTNPLVTISSVPTGVALVSVSSAPASAPTDFVITVSSQNGTTTFATKYDGDLVSSGTTPSMGTCGTSPSVLGTDTAGVISVGSGVVTSCTMNWANTKGSIPVCVMSTNSTAVTGDITTTSTSSITFGFSATLGGGTINYICIGNKG